MKKILFIFLIFAFSVAKSQTIGLIIGDGQSNMSGVNDISSNRTLLDFKYWMSPYTYIWDSLSSNWQYMIVRDNLTGDYGLGSQPNRLINMTPFVSLAHNVDSLATREFRFLMYAYGGSQLYQESGVQDWNVNSVDEYYNNYVSEINSAANNLSSQGIKIDTIYRIKYQGEQDADDLDKSNAFYQNESDFIDSLEANFNYPFRHILIEIVDTYTYSSTINGALSTIAGERSNAVLYENTNFIYSGVHIDNASQIELGDSLFQLIHNY
jgi:hypothetical protein